MLVILVINLYVCLLKRLMLDARIIADVKDAKMFMEQRRVRISFFFFEMIGMVIYDI